MLLSFETYWKHPNLEPFYFIILWQLNSTHSLTHTDKQTDRPIVEASKREEIISKQNKTKKKQQHSVELQQQQV